MTNILISFFIFYYLIIKISGSVFAIEFVVSWINCSPDGVSRKVIAINGFFPTPTIRVISGDSVKIKVINNLNSMEMTSINCTDYYKKAL